MEGLGPQWSLWSLDPAAVRPGPALYGPAFPFSFGHCALALPSIAQCATRATWGQPAQPGGEKMALGAYRGYNKMGAKA